MTNLTLHQGAAAIPAAGAHAAAQALFSDRLEGELSPEARARLEAHLSTCAPCAEAYQRFARAVGLVREEPRPRAPTGLMRRILKRVRARRRSRAAWFAEIRTPAEGVIVVILAAAAAAVLAAMIFGVS